MKFGLPSTIRTCDLGLRRAQPYFLKRLLMADCRLSHTPENNNIRTAAIKTKAAIFLKIYPPCFYIEMMMGGCLPHRKQLAPRNIKYPTPLSKILRIGLPIRKGLFRGYGYGEVWILGNR